jgi:putative copper export protein
VLAVVGFALAAGRISVGWPLAAVGVIVGPLSAIFTGQWARLVNPLHVLFGGLWIGTLFILVVAGLSMVLRDEPSREERGRLAADMVNAFSPLALTCGALLVASGLTTAWRHLGSVPALWSTPYGYALLVKLALVATVFVLGAWNWRRQRPTLGTEGAAIAIRRSARAELTMAGLVLIVTSVLGSLPPPAEQREHAPPPPATTPETAEMAE